MIYRRSEEQVKVNAIRQFTSIHFILFYNKCEKNLVIWLDI